MKKKLKKYKPRHKFYYDEVYLMAYIFLFNYTKDKEIECVLKKNYPVTYKWYLQEKNTGSNVSIEDSGGKNIQGKHRQIIMVRGYDDRNFKVADFYDSLAHECLHATMHTFKERGVEYDKESHNEHYTYYLGMLVRVALEK